MNVPTACFVPRPPDAAEPARWHVRCTVERIEAIGGRAPIDMIKAIERTEPERTEAIVSDRV